MTGISLTLFDSTKVENKKPTFIILAFDNQTGRISLKPSESTTEIKSFLSYQAGIAFHMGSSTYYIPAKSWHNFLSNCHTKSYTLSFVLDTQDEIHKYINKADYSVTLDAKHGRIVIRKRDAGVASLYAEGLSSWYAGVDYYSVATSEAYKLVSILPKHNPGIKLDYAEEVSVLLEAEIKKRASILAFASMEDAPEISDDINLTLRPFQKVAKAFSRHVGDKAIISYDMGLGKTPIAISIAEGNPDILSVLIICPATLKTNWKREIKKCTGLDAIVLAGAAPGPTETMMLLDKKYKYYIINYDIIGRGSRDKEAGLFVSPWAQLVNMANFDLIINDEAHYIKNTDSGRSKAVRQIQFNKVLHLTGTPVVNRPAELWPLLNTIDPVTFSSKESFEGQWFYGGKTIKNPAQFREMLSLYMIRRKKEDVIKDLPSIERIDHFVEIQDKEWSRYNLALQGLKTSLSNPDYQKEITSILAQIQFLKQIIADACAVHSASLARDIYEETEKKVLIFSHYINSCKEITSFLGNEALCLTGEDSDEARYSKIDKFQNDDNIKFMVLSTKAGAEGITLTKAHYVIFNDLEWTPKDHRQAEARCYGRMNDMHGAVAYYLQVENTITADIMEILRSKMIMIEESVDGVNRDAIANASILNEFISKMRGK